MKISYHNCFKIAQKNNIQSKQEGFAENYKDTVQMQRGRNNRGVYDSSAYTFIMEYTTKSKHIEFYGIWKGEK